MSLIEVMVAILLLGIVTVPLFNFFITGNIFTAIARRDVDALNFAQEIMEEIKSVPYDWFGKVPEEHPSVNKVYLPEDFDINNNPKNCLISITGGKGEGQVSKIIEDIIVPPDDPKKKEAIIEPNWDHEHKPDQTSSYLICRNSIFGFGMVGGVDEVDPAKTIILDENESSEDGFYKGYFIKIAGGTGSGQVRKIIGYEGSTKVATVNKSWDIIPVKDKSSYKLYRYDYKIDCEPDLVNQLKKITVTAYYDVNNLSREVSFSTDQARR